VFGGFVEYLCWLVCGGLGCREAASGVSLREFFLGFGCWLMFVASPLAVVVGGVLVLGEWLRWLVVVKTGGLKSPCQGLCFGGLLSICVGWCAGGWGVAKPQAVSRCASFFLGFGCWLVVR